MKEYYASTGTIPSDAKYYKGKFEWYQENIGRCNSFIYRHEKSLIGLDLIDQALLLLSSDSLLLNAITKLKGGRDTPFLFRLMKVLNHELEWISTYRKTQNMTLTLSDLKNNSLSLGRNTLTKLNDTQNTKEEDTRFWKPVVDESGNGSAVIRFLPGPYADGKDADAIVKYFDHFFKGTTGKWYAEKSLTSIGKQDPIGELNSRLWATKDPALQNIVRQRKRQLHYVANIYVVSHPARKEDEGKVFLYRFGKKIFEKIENKMNDDNGLGEDNNEDIFDFWNGRNFKLKIKKVAGYQNYDNSEFMDKSPLSKDDEALMKIWKSEYSLKEFNDPNTFKSYDELKDKLIEALGSDYTDAAPFSEKKETKPTSSKREEAEPLDDDAFDARIDSILSELT